MNTRCSMCQSCGCSPMPFSKSAASCWVMTAAFSLRVPSAGTGIGVPYILPIGLWVLAAASVITVGQRIIAVHQGLAVQPAAAPAATPPAATAAPAADGDAAEQTDAEQTETGSAAAAHTIE